MGDLSEYNTLDSQTVELIYEHHKTTGDAQPQRGYLGGSIIGRECERALWYTFRGCTRPEFSGRLYRLFETGHLEEIRMVRELRAIGCEVHEEGEDGKQFGVSAFGGHFSGHMDGVALGIPEAPKTWHLLEFKTHNAKSFKALQKSGMRGTKAEHWAQMQVYMGLGKLTRGLYIARNKDNDELYAERVRFDAGEFQRIMDKAQRIIEAAQPPERCTEKAEDWRCRFCDHKALCWGGEGVAVPIQARNCRTCIHATPETDSGKWTCAKHKKDLTRDQELAGCGYHLLIPGLVSFADPVDSSGIWVEYKNRHDGGHWKNSTAYGDPLDWTTVNLMTEEDGGPRECPFKVEAAK